MKFYSIFIIIFVIPSLYVSNAAASFYWVVGQSIDLDNYEFTKSDSNTEYQNKDTVFVFGQSARNFDFLVYYGKRSDDNYEKSIRKFKLNLKHNFIDTKFIANVGASVIYDISNEAFIDGNEYKHNDLIFNPSLGFGYKIDEFTLGGNIGLNKQFLKIADISQFKSTYGDKIWTNIQFLIGFSF